MKNKFKVGDWCFCEFKLQQIKKMNGGPINEVSDGTFSHMGNDLNDRCFHINMTIKQISDTVSFYSKRFHEIKLNINHPDLHRKLVSMWVEMCEVHEDEEKLNVMYKNLETFSQKIMARVSELEYEDIDGMKLFRS